MRPDQSFPYDNKYPGARMLRKPETSFVRYSGCTLSPILRGA
jgi:hypothetical protein